MDLEPHLNNLRERIQQRLTADTAVSQDCPPRLAESIRYSLLAPGKRVRPCLTLLACEACGEDPDRALPAASAIEMIHCYSLIHDDLPAMDDDDLRRGRPTNHIQFDEPTAILAGDGLLTLAFQILAQGVQPKSVAAECIIDLASAAGVEGMVGGQQADLEAESATEMTLAQLEAIHRRKTGRLLVAALTMGGRIGNADPQTLRNLTIYGESVGLAFQIADDLLDVTGDVHKMGKGVQKDAQHGKLTYPALLGLEESRQRARSLVDQACDAVQFLGPRGQYLTALARYIIERDH
ncbi:polyprenyl synthetase family protein [Planctomicrobium sp. SH664]|uniref:polyprenyl synthetase family protein n=1 Tax=Planctomicrobium sp. SH664 TaxID=3448125 RepID=UPI003F5C4EDB